MDFVNGMILITRPEFMLKHFPNNFFTSLSVLMTELITKSKAKMKEMQGDKTREQS